MKKMRAEESYEEREVRLEALRSNNAVARKAESDEEKKRRLEVDRNNTAAARQAESEEVKKARLEADRINTATARDAESEQQRTARLEAMRINNAEARVSRRQSIKSKYSNIGRRVDTADFYEDSENDCYDKYDVGRIYDQQVCPHCSAYRWPGKTQSEHYI